MLIKIKTSAPLHLWSACLSTSWATCGRNHLWTWGASSNGQNSVFGLLPSPNVGVIPDSWHFWGKNRILSHVAMAQEYGPQHCQWLASLCADGYPAINLQLVKCIIQSHQQKDPIDSPYLFVPAEPKVGSVFHVKMFELYRPYVGSKKNALLYYQLIIPYEKESKPHYYQSEWYEEPCTSYFGIFWGSLSTRV